MDPVVKAPEGFVLPTQWKFLYCITAPVLKPMEKKSEDQKDAAIHKDMQKGASNQQWTPLARFFLRYFECPVVCLSNASHWGIPPNGTIKFRFRIHCKLPRISWAMKLLLLPMTWSMGFFMGFFGGGNQKHWLMAVFKDRCICLLKKGRVFQLQFIVPKIRGWFSGRFD